VLLIKKPKMYGIDTLETDYDDIIDDRENEDLK